VIASTVKKMACLAVMSAALAAGCGEAKDLRFRIYDPAHKSNIEIVNADLVRESARAVQVPGNPPALYFKLTHNGESKFRRLSYALAKRGQRLQAIQEMAVEVDDKVYPTGVDYQAYPHGLNPDTGFEVSVDSLATARRLAKEMRSG
jgi:hypothetical protein